MKAQKPKYHTGDRIFYKETNRVYTATVIYADTDPVTEPDNYKYLIGVDDKTFDGHKGVSLIAKNVEVPLECRTFIEASTCWWVYQSEIDSIPSYIEEVQYGL